MRDVLDEAAKRIEDAGGRFEDKPLVEASIRLTLGNTYRQLGEYPAAEPHLEQARGLRRRELGDEHPDTLLSMNSLADLYDSQGRYGDAEPLYRQTLDVRRSVLGDEHPDTLLSMNNLASVYWHQRRVDDAEPLFRETLDGRRRVLGEEHPDTLSTMNDLAHLYERQRRYREAHLLCREAMEIRIRVLGNEHPDTLASMNRLAVLYRRARRYDDAATLFQQILDTRERILGDEHPATLSSLEQLVMVYRGQKRTSEADTLVHELLDRRRSRAYQQNASPIDKNQYAWALLICRPVELRDPPTALRLSLEANEMTGDENTGFLDTLSLAYHRTGDTVKAIETQKRAIALLPAGDTDLRRHMKIALAKYEAALPTEQEAVASDKPGQSSSDEKQNE